MKNAKSIFLFNTILLRKTELLGQLNKGVFLFFDITQCFNSLSLDYCLLLKMHGVQTPSKIFSLVSFRKWLQWLQQCVPDFLLFYSVLILYYTFSFFLLKSSGLLKTDYSKLHLK